MFDRIRTEFPAACVPLIIGSAGAIPGLPCDEEQGLRAARQIRCNLRTGKGCFNRAIARKEPHDVLYGKFLASEGIALDCSWWGWVQGSDDMLLRIFRPDMKHKIFYAMGCGGNGVM